MLFRLNYIPTRVRPLVVLEMRGCYILPPANTRFPAPKILTFFDSLPEVLNVWDRKGGSNVAQPSCGRQKALKLQKINIPIFDTNFTFDPAYIQRRHLQRQNRTKSTYCDLFNSIEKS